MTQGNDVSNAALTHNYQPSEAETAAQVNDRLGKIREDRIYQLAKLVKVPVDILKAVVYTYEEAQGRYPEFERRAAAHHIFHYLGDPRGYDGGSFMHSLITTWKRADNGNRGRLALAFPVYADAFDVLETEGSNALARWAGIAE